jgi:hypothetical protein
VAVFTILYESLPSPGYALRVTDRHRIRAELCADSRNLIILLYAFSA